MSELVKWIDRRDGHEIRVGETHERKNIVEIRSASPGWRWHDFDFHEWETTTGTHGPIWRPVLRKVST